MFNAPRTRPQGSFAFNSQTSSSTPNLTSSYDPLAFNDQDPWSTAPSPSYTPPTYASTPAPAPPPPAATSGSGGPSSNGNSGTGGIIDEDRLSSIYQLALEAVDPYGRGEGGISLTAAGRVLRSSGLGSSEIERIINIVSSNKPRITRLEFHLALLLVGLSQEGEEPSIDRAISRKHNPPVPSLNLDSITSTGPSSSLSTSAPINADPAPSSHVSDHTSSPSTNSSHYVPPTFPPPTRTSPPPPPPAPARRLSADPWSTTVPTSPPIPTLAPLPSHSHSYPSSLVAAPSTGLKGGLLAIDKWWEKEMRIRVTLVPEREGRFLNKWTVYGVEVVRPGEETGGVHRRYSEFTWLWETLLKRYPFRCIVGLPPKRLGADGSFLEQRRRGLSRFLNFVVNHPTLKADHLVQVFLHEPNLEAWRKSTPISLEEESKGKGLSEREEMEVPGDLEDKLAIARRLLTPKVHSWSNIVTIFERHSRRLEALGADSSRFAMALSSLVEASSETWKGGIPVNAVSGWGGEERERDELGEGVREGLKRVGRSFEELAVGADQRSQQLLLVTLEALKSERDLYLAFRDLFLRHDRLSLDPVSKLQKKIELAQQKVLAVQATKKPNFEAEVDKIAGQIEAAQAEVAGWMARRGVIRSIMWSELAFLLHPRENTMVTLAFQQFAREEATYSQEVELVWRRLEEGLETMPLEG
ncbi:hypothetical protein BDY24DRAFT_381406 [Mrakia frigida]|uniref:Mvp1p n=1 Tax=Mrakia frigida TaxID=29902 RepID=UPI003FCC0566